MPPTAFPLLFYNLGGEMLYVLNQRLQAQQVSKEKSAKVLSDIIGTMFKSHFLKQMFEGGGQEMIHGGRAALKNIFKKLIHASVMRVSKDSMDKLFDLMLMAVKHQTIESSDPRLLILICLNHLDELMLFVADDAPVKSQVVAAFMRVTKTYGSCSMGEMAVVRQRILTFLQGVNVKITMYLTEKIQTNAGRFAIKNSGPVAQGFKVPGTIIITGCTTKETFNTGGDWTEAEVVQGASLEIGGVRATNLGCNVYNNLDLMAAYSSLNVGKRDSDVRGEKKSKMAAAELDLLSQMLSVRTDVDNTTEFKIDLFGPPPPTNTRKPDNIPTPSSTSDNKQVLNITASHNRDHLSKIMEDLTTTTPTSTAANDHEDDLLDLMDSL